MAYNGDTGIRVASGTGNAIRANSIHDNHGLGIDVGAAGVNGNDEGDGDSGANNLQNYPVLISTTPTLVESPEGGTRIQGILRSAPSTIYDLDVFANDACVRFPKEFLEGRTYLGSGQVTTDALRHRRHRHHGADRHRGRRTDQPHGHGPRRQHVGALAASALHGHAGLGAVDRGHRRDDRADRLRRKVRR